MMNLKNRKSPRLQHWDYGRDAAYFITICTKDREFFFGEIINGKMVVSPAGAIAHVLWCETKNHAKNVELGEFVVMPNHMHGILILNGNIGGRDVADIGGRDVADIGGRDVVDIGGRDVANIGDRDVANIGGRDVADIGGRDVANIGDRDVADIGGRDVADIGGRDVVDIGGRDVANIGDRDVACNVPTETEMKNEQMAIISPKSNTVSSIIRSYKSSVTKYCNKLGLPMAWQPRYHDHIIRNDESFHRISEYIKNNPLNWSSDQFRQRRD